MLSAPAPCIAPARRPTPFAAGRDRAIAALALGLAIEPLGQVPTREAWVIRVIMSYVIRVMRVMKVMRVLRVSGWPIRPLVLEAFATILRHGPACVRSRGVWVARFIRAGVEVE